MTRDDQVAALRRARAEVARVTAGCESPQIETILRSADMELHWALWNLGEPVALRADFNAAQGVGGAGDGGSAAAASAST